MASLPPIPPEALSLPDDELGKLLLGYWIAANAEAAGHDVGGIPQGVAERIVANTRKMVMGENPQLGQALVLAAEGEFRRAGKRLRRYMAG